MSITILIIEDQDHLREYMKKILEREHYQVLCSSCGQEALSLLKNNNPDIILLDLNLGDMDGREIITILRRQHDEVPIMIVSNFNEVDTKVHSFDLGCDDYLTKPFYKDELLARIKRLHTRVKYTKLAEEHKLKEKESFGPFSVDYKTGQIQKNGQGLDLSRKLFDLMVYFLMNRNQIVSKEQLLNRFWWDQDNQSDNTLIVHIHMLRSLIEETPSKPQFLKTKRGMGYLFAIDKEEYQTLSD